MTTLKSKMIIWTLRNRHLMQGRLTPERVTFDTDTLKLRKQLEDGGKRFGKLAEGVHVAPVSIPGLAEGCAAEWIYPQGAPDRPGPATPAIFYTHGGGYISGSCEGHRVHVTRFVKASGIGALLFDYRLAPEHPFPAAVEDTLAAYRWLLAQGVDPARTVIAGESAGGGLCLAALLAMRDSGLALPAAGVAISPWLDLTCSAEAYTRNARRDISTLGSWEVWSQYYIGDNDPRHPWISPVYGDLGGLPPLLIEVGDYEIMVDAARRVADTAQAAGVEMHLRVWPGMVHCFPLLAGMFKEADQAWEEVIAFIRKHAAA